MAVEQQPGQFVIPAAEGRPFLLIVVTLRAM
jgi:hypothetical protein